MRPSIARFSIALLLLGVVACVTSSRAANPEATSLFPTAESSPSATNNVPGVNPSAQGSASPASVPTAAVAMTAGSDFAVAVVVDTTTQQVGREQAQAVIEQASKFLRAFSPVGLVMADYAEDAAGGPTAGMAERYLAARSTGLPDGLVIFSNGDNGQAKTSGGYGFTVPAPAGFKSRFTSPTGASVMYVAVVDYAFKYMPCGYGGEDTVKSGTALGGECRGKTGSACVMQNGYSMCSDAVGNLYSSSPTYAASSMIVHGLLHNFGPGGDKDHYTTEECNARMGYPPSFFDLQESEYYNGLCPFVYELFTASYHP
jgi:hypothetical protein